MSDFLFELGVEEVPISEIKGIIDQLKTKFQSRLKEIPVEFKSLETAATNRRFMIYITDIDKQASDVEEQIKGPAVKIAYDEKNEPTLALKKFMESHDITSSDLIEIKTPKGLYVGFERKTAGKKTAETLKEIIPAILGELSFAKTMVWNESRVPFVRPIKSLLALFDGQVIEFEFADIKSANITRGHALLSDKSVRVHSFKEYCELLYKNFVIISEDERKKKIVDEIVEVEEEFNVRIRPDNKMLQEYIYNNEYPVLFSGEFDKKYLDLPSEIISTFMINEKKLLPAYNKENTLTNHFIGVANIPDESKHVVRGNERVIRATFEDAKFFWDNDRRDDFFAHRESLKNVMFHEGLGTFHDKTERLAISVDFLVEETHNDHLAERLQKAAHHCKSDLVTRMVREFPSLQGIMGGLYLEEANQEKEVWQAVYWHYEPKGFTDIKLENLGGGLLSIADKIDNIAGFLFKGIKHSSSKDPYGIRRDANAIIKIVKDFQLDFDLDSLIRFAAQQYIDAGQEDAGQALEALTSDIYQLFLSRIENIFKDFLHFRYDVVNAVLSRVESLHIYRMYLRAYEVFKIINSESLQHLVALHKRLRNIIKDAKPFQVDEKLLEEKEEKILYEIFKETAPKIETFIAEKGYLQACSEFVEMKPVIDNFFDNVLVMAEDQKLKENRLALLQSLDTLLSQVADFSLIVE